MANLPGSLSLREGKEEPEQGLVITDIISLFEFYSNLDYTQNVVSKWGFPAFFFFFYNQFRSTSSNISLALNRDLIAFGFIRQLLCDSLYIKVVVRTIPFLRLLP